MRVYSFARVLALVLYGLAVLGPGLHAQRLPQKAFKQLTKKAAKGAQKAARAAAVRAQAAAYRAKLAEQLAHAPYDIQKVKANIKSAVFFMYTPLVQTSGFFFEENYFGKRLVWAVAPAHAVGEKFPFFAAEYVGLDGEIHRRAFRIMAYGSSGYQNYDFALALVPEEVKKEVFALRLAQEKPKKGDKVSSFGFYGLDETAEFAGPPKENVGRVIVSIDNSRITTSYPFGDQDPAGACGGPLLNEAGEVVGIHSGSNGNASCSFAVEAPGPVREMLADYHGDRQLLRPVVWKGQLILQLTSSQRISQVEVVRNGRIVAQVFLTKRETPFDYAFLEKLFPQARPGDKIRLVVKDQRLSESEGVEFWVE